MDRNQKNIWMQVGIDCRVYKGLSHRTIEQYSQIFGNEIQKLSILREERIFLQVNCNPLIYKARVHRKTKKVQGIQVGIDSKVYK